MLSIQTVALPDNVRLLLENQSQQKPTSELQRVIFTTLSFLAILGLTSPLFGIALWFEEPHRLFGMLTRLGFILVIFWLVFLLLSLRGRKGEIEILSNQNQFARSVLATGTIERYDLEITDENLFVEDEHGFWVYIPSGEKKTLALFICSVSDDPRYDLLDPEKPMATHWNWYQKQDSQYDQIFCFETSGPTFEPNWLCRTSKYDPDISGKIFEYLGSPCDGELIHRSFAEVLAFSRACLGEHTQVNSAF